MLFTPKKRSRDYYRTGMATLYVFSIIFGIGAISAVILPSAYVDEDRIQTVVIFVVIALASFAVGKAFSNIAAAMPTDRRQKP